MHITQFYAVIYCNFISMLPSMPVKVFTIGARSLSFLLRALAPILCFISFQFLLKKNFSRSRLRVCGFSLWREISYSTHPHRHKYILRMKIPHRRQQQSKCGKRRKDDWKIWKKFYGRISLNFAFSLLPFCAALRLPMVSWRWAGGWWRDFSRK